MSENYISASLRRLVEERANYRCEYCLLPANVAFFSHEIDHIIAQKHGGITDANNLALTCWRCNRHKGSDLGSFDPETGEFSFLFNPRTQEWIEHFTRENLTIFGVTPEGRTTVKLLQMNTQERLTERRRLCNSSDLI
ncbi:MAG: HNH endonuclease [Chroococcales cyanobacterium]